MRARPPKPIHREHDSGFFFGVGGVGFFHQLHTTGSDPQLGHGTLNTTPTHSHKHDTPTFTHAQTEHGLRVRPARIDQ